MPQEIHGAPCNAKGYITFGSFNDPIKVNSTVLQTWQRILTAVPNSRLLLKGRMFNAYQGIETMKNTLLMQVLNWTGWSCGALARIIFENIGM